MEEDAMLVGDKVVLRTMRAGDLEEIFKHIHDVRDRGLMGYRLFSENEYRKKFEESGFWDLEGEKKGVFCITDLEDSLLGFISFWRVSPHMERPSYEVGCRIFRPEDWGNGYATAATQICTAWLFDTLDIHRIEALTHTENSGSIHVLEKCGFQHEGVLRKYFFFRGEVVDANIFSLLREECQALETYLASK
jgi:RimJ/RimL family protein N-acetyltransferase